MKPGDVYCIPNAPKQHGDLWVEVTPEENIRVMDPAGAWWRGRTFTADEFRAAFKADFERLCAEQEAKNADRAKGPLTSK